MRKIARHILTKIYWKGKTRGKHQESRVEEEKMGNVSKRS